MSSASSSSPSTSPPPYHILVLISGNGSNLQALIDAVQAADKFPRGTTITRVISNRREAYGLTRAAQASIPTAYHNLVPYKQREESTPEGIARAREKYDVDLARMIIDGDSTGTGTGTGTGSPSRKPDLVVCAGWMHILSAKFIEMLTEAGIAIINLHPAKPGAFNGAHAIQRAYAAFQRGEITETGIMIHYVISEVDMGEPIVVRPVPMRREESLEELETRIHEAEWELIVDGTRRALEVVSEERRKQQQQEQKKN